MCRRRGVRRGSAPPPGGCHCGGRCPTTRRTPGSLSAPWLLQDSRSRRFRRPTCWERVFSCGGGGPLGPPSTETRQADSRPPPLLLGVCSRLAVWWRGAPSRGSVCRSLASSLVFVGWKSPPSARCSGCVAACAAPFSPSLPPWPDGLLPAMPPYACPGGRGPPCCDSARREPGCGFVHGRGGGSHARSRRRSRRLAAPAVSVAFARPPGLRLQRP